ncbi:MAG: lytic transglycosylase [Deltaproteobacteria bacterium]|nr:lytic transglycosylase [Deltaproteobacteria bacterium]
MKPKRLLQTLLSGLLGFGLVAASLGVPTAEAAPRDFPQPSELKPDIAFWTRIYSEIGTDAGLLHDSRDLSIVFETTKIPPGLSNRAQERHTEKRKKHYKKILLRLAKGKRSNLSREEKRVLALYGSGVSNATLRTAAGRVRFQLGQANKFRAGVIRSGVYKPHILRILRDMSLPLEIANLPHVESSYTPTVYSRVGAAGLWQFTRSTGRRFMRVDHVVDERLDPYRASLAAARLLEQNFRVTGSWPLAITAYNHGASGMRRAARKLGTKDIATIVRKYRSRTFGFASRNFYVEFLAANAVASNAETYFGPLSLDRPISFESIELPFYAKPSPIAAAIGVDIDTLREANPSLRQAVWRGSKYVPKGFDLQVPRAALPRPLGQAIAAIPADQRHARQTRDSSYVVRRGDTLSTIARRHHVRMSELVALNGLKSRHRIRVGQKIRLPSDATRSTRKAAYTPPSKPARSSKPAPTVALPDSGYYTVRRGDNLTHIANRFGLEVPQLVAMNDLRSRNRIAAGQQLRVSESAPKPPAAEKEAKAETAANSAHPDAIAVLSPARSAEPAPSPTDRAAAESTTEPDEDRSSQALAGGISDGSSTDESAVEPSPGLLADPSDYTVASNGSILVQANETLGHYAEWLGLRASRLREINGFQYGEPVVVQQRLQLDFSSVRPEDFEHARIDYHRTLQEEFFAEWEIEGTVVHRVGRGDSLWTLSTRRFDVPIWLLRQYNPDVNLDALSAGTPLTVPKLRQRNDEANLREIVGRRAIAG